MFWKILTQSAAVASSAAGAVDLNLGSSSGSRVPVGIALATTQRLRSLELACLMGFGQQVRLILMCVGFPELAGAAVVHGADPVLLCLICSA